VKRGLKLVTEANELMEISASSAQTSNKAQKVEVVEKTASAGRISFAIGTAVVISLIASVLFSFFGIARPMTLLNAALGQMAGGNLDVVIPGADRGDEIGDLAKTVTVIRQNAENKAHDEAEAQVGQAHGQAHRGAGCVFIGYRAAVGEVHVPGLAVMPGQLRMNRVPDQQGIELPGHFGAPARRAGGEDAVEFGPQRPQGFQVGPGGAGAQVFPVGHQQAQLIHRGQPVVAVLLVGGRVGQPDGEFRVCGEVHIRSLGAGETTVLTTG